MFPKTRYYDRWNVSNNQIVSRWNVSNNQIVSKDDTPVQVIIDNGELLSGNLCKNSLGQRGGSLMHIIFNELGKEVAADFYFNIQTVVNNWLVYNGHSIGGSLRF